jgi:hypothetical protein
MTTTLDCPGSGVSVPVVAEERYTSAIAPRIGQREVIVAKERRWGVCPTCGRRLILGARRAMPRHVGVTKRGR